MYPPGGILEMTCDTLVRTSKCLMHETHMSTGFHLSVQIIYSTLAHLKLLWFHSAAKHYFPT